MLKEFQEFALKGNMVDLAIGVIIGAAFGGLVQSIVNDILMPIIGLILCIVGLSKAKKEDRPRGLAIAGLILAVITLAGFVFITLIFGASILSDTSSSSSY